MSTDRQSLRDYDSDRYGPFLGISGSDTASKAIRDAADGSPKAQVLGDDPFKVGVGHDAERLRSVGEVPVGPDEYRRISEVAAGHVLITTNVGSHVNLWHNLQPPGRDLDTNATDETIAAWAHENAHDYRVRDPQPWLRLRPHPDLAEDQLRELVVAASAQAPVCLAVKAEQGAAQALRAIDTAAAGRAAAVVVAGIAKPPSEGRPALPGLLNYFSATETRHLLTRAQERGILIEPALKIDTRSVANQVWAGLYAARAMGLHLGKYGLFPLTFPESEQVIRTIQGWTAGWTAAPAFYIDVPWIDGHLVYEPSEAFAATKRWLELAAGAGAEVVLIDTVDKASGHHLLCADPADERGIFSWEEVDMLHDHAKSLNIKALWAGGIELKNVRAFGRSRVFGVYVTTAASQERPVEGEEQADIGLARTKQPAQDKIALVRLLLDAGFLDDEAIQRQAHAAEAGGDQAVAELDKAVAAAWQARSGTL